MITDDRMCLGLYSSWVCSLRNKNDPHLSEKVEIIKGVMDALGVEGIETFDTLVEEYWKRHYLYEQPKRWRF